MLHDFIHVSVPLLLGSFRAALSCKSEVFSRCQWEVQCTLNLCSLLIPDADLWLWLQGFRAASLLITLCFLWDVCDFFFASSTACSGWAASGWMQTEARPKSVKMTKAMMMKVSSKPENGRSIYTMVEDSQQIFSDLKMKISKRGTKGATRFCLSSVCWSSRLFIDDFFFFFFTVHHPSHSSVLHPGSK